MDNKQVTTAPETLRIFIGYDPRQPVSYNVLQQSIIVRSTKPVAITPLIIQTLPLKRTGLTPFTFTRFLAPYLCNFEGWSLFLDADIILREDISQLFDMRDDKYAVMVSKNVHKFEWASVMLFNNAKCKILTPEYIETAEALHQIKWANDDEIGDLPPEWNHLVGYDNERPDAKLVHYTQGVPVFPETNDSEYAQDFIDEIKWMNSAMPWEVLMGPSIHACDINGKRQPKYRLKKLLANPNAVVASNEAVYDKTR